MQVHRDEPGQWPPPLVKDSKVGEGSKVLAHFASFTLQTYNG